MSARATIGVVADSDPASALPTPTGLAQYSDEQLGAILTTGKRPNGTMVNPPMPWYFYANMKKPDIDAIIVYLRSLPPK